ncbi:accessory Sec system translocase SecA2 [Leucobacter albus]|uniref:Protein translocase subunit SecA n=1 Tax=Leucobacter albus TaxID=272210 RepID=A0ABW3TL61_9MICO
MAFLTLTDRLPVWLRRVIAAPGAVSFSRLAGGEHRELLTAIADASSDALGLTPTPQQLTAAAALLAGHGVEMDTGEGKTLVGAMAAAGLALLGRRAHVLSVNDYLARRDAAWMGPLFDALGVSVAAIGQGTAHVDRREAYCADVLYAPVSEVGYDVLRNGIAWAASERLDIDFDAVIVDEADAVMIDEAVSPLVLAGETERTGQDFGEEVAIVMALTPGVDYECDEHRSTAFLTDRGLEAVERSLGGEDLYGSSDGARLSRINVALMAVAIAERDVDYVVMDRAVKLVSASRGRIARMQRWPDGLHAAVEAKEGLAASRPGTILDSLTVQELLGRYAHRSGMSGTLVAVARELEEFYGIRTGRVERSAANARVDHPPVGLLTRAEKLSAIVGEVGACHSTGRPVLVGTQSVDESEEIASLLAAAGVSARVLNARNDEAEAEVISRAGEPGAVTISTQISGRGTDIRLGGAAEEHRREVVAAGGLSVLASGMYPSRRLDAQLRGRAGRQGDPGSTRVFLSMDDDLVAENAPGYLRQRFARSGSRLGSGALGTAPLGSDALAKIAATSQEIAEAIRLDQHRATWEYSLAISRQRRTVLEYREEILLSGAGATGARAAAAAVGRHDADLLAGLVRGSGEAAAQAACRDVTLWQLDELWSEHLELLSELRDGIHLRVLGGEHPTDAFHLQALKEFDGFFATLDERVVSELRLLDPDDLGASVAAAVRRPSSTWTYMLIDNPLGSKSDRAVRGMQRLLKIKP